MTTRSALFPALLLMTASLGACSVVEVSVDADGEGGTGAGGSSAGGAGGGGAGGDGGGAAGGGAGGREDPCDLVDCAPGFSCEAGTGRCLCGGADCAAGQECVASACVDPLPVLCTPGSAWTAGTQAFRAADWGLAALGVAGQRISAADVDDDGLLDLYVRRGNAGDDFAPGGARTTWLLRNTGGAFLDVTQASGVAALRRDVTPGRGRPGQVVAFGDVDNDGDLDLYTGLSAQPGTPAPIESGELLLNAGDGSFALGPAEASFRKEGRFLERSGASFVDFDRDGFLDLWLGAGAVDGTPQQDELHRGLGLGHFEEVTSFIGVRTEAWNQVAALNEGRAHTNTWSTAACDLDGDGTTELLSASYGRAPNHLFVGARAADGAVSFQNRSVASGYAFDEKQDWSDNESARCWCKLHRADPGCADVPLPELIRCTTDADAFRWNHDFDREPFRLGGNSGTTVCADLNGDGRLDLLTTEIVHWDVGGTSDPSEALFNSGEAALRFDRPGNDVTGLSKEHCPAWNDGDITAAAFDFDNDGRMDVYIGTTDYPGTRGHLYRQVRDGVFEELPIDLGIDQRSSHGLAVGDFDRDGDLDLVVGHSRARCGAGGGCEDHCYPDTSVRLFENVLGQQGNWLQLDPRGAGGTNGRAIGARVEVRTPDGRVQVQEVGGGHGHYGIQHDLVQHFGLGANCEAEVSVRWPDESLTTQHFTIAAGYRYRIVQGGAPAAIR